MRIRIADVVADIQMRYRYTAALCERYRVSEDTPTDFTVAVGDDDLAYESVRDAQSVREMEASPVAPHRAEATPALLESAALYRKLCHLVLDRDMFLLHGSALSLDGVGYLFTAPSGTGKSTHTALWREAFGERVVMVNDDKPLVCVREDGVFAAGTPWDGKHHLSSPVTVPLAAVCFLVRGEENHIRALTRREAYAQLLAQVYRPDDPALMMKTLQLVDRAAAHIRFYELTCNMTPEAAYVACRGMGGTV